MEIAIVLYYVSLKFYFQQNLEHLIQILIDLLNTYRLVGEQHKLHLFYLAKIDLLQGVNDSCAFLLKNQVLRQQNQFLNWLDGSSEQMFTIFALVGFKDRI